MVVDYFTKWVKAMPTVKSYGETNTHCVFNYIITQFEIQKDIVIDNGSPFQKKMMSELALKLGFKLYHSSSYYPQENDQVGVVDKYLKVILQNTVRDRKSNYHIMLYPPLWEY